MWREQNLSLNQITSVLLLDSDSNRLVAKYYAPLHADPKSLPPASTPSSYSTLKEQRAFETGLWEKTRKLNGTSSLPTWALPSADPGSSQQVTSSSTTITSSCTSRRSI